MICVWLVGGVLWRYLVEFFARGSSRELLSGANNMGLCSKLKGEEPAHWFHVRSYSGERAAAQDAASRCTFKH